MKAPSEKTCRLRDVLKAMAERPVSAPTEGDCQGWSEGERDNAKRRLAAMEKRYDFTKKLYTKDIFLGTFTRANVATPILSFGPSDFDIANAVKWAIENLTRIPCVYTGDFSRQLAASARVAVPLEEVSAQLDTAIKGALCQTSTRRIDAAGNRACKHTRSVDAGLGEREADSVVDYANKPQPNIPDLPTPTKKPGKAQGRQFDFDE